MYITNHMEKNEPFTQNLTRCKELMLSGQIVDALALGQKLLQQDSENLPLHLLLATLYARSNELMKALSHYVLLAQFDPGFEEPHCKEMARGYHLKGLTEAGAVLAQAGAVKLQSKELMQLAIDYYTQAGNVEQAQKLREQWL